METTSTPMLQQYHALKTNHQDCILFFRLGDFYEMFYDDAKLVSRLLDLVLTSRGKGTDHAVPMCGFPHHAADNYISRLVKAGHKIAICDQLEDPALAKGLVKRDVTRIITAGTYLDENSPANRHIVSLCPNQKNIGFAFIDPTEGTIHANEYPIGSSRMTELIGSLSVQECLFPDTAEESVRALFRMPLLAGRRVLLSPNAAWSFNPDISRNTLREHFGVHNLSGFGLEDKHSAIAAAGALLEYLRQMNKQPLKHIDRLSLYIDEDTVFISPAARLGLELDSLIETLDRTVSPLGRRMFRQWLSHPLNNPERIKARQHAVKVPRPDVNTQRDLENLLSAVPDIEKNISRLSCGYTHPKDLLALRNTLDLVPRLRQLTMPLAEQNSLFTLEDIPDLRQLLTTAVNPDMPIGQPEGQVVLAGYDKELDELRDLQAHGREWLAQFQKNEIKRTGINSLKVGFNRVFGYYIEITNAHKNAAPADYIRKQTLVNGERYITPELKEYEEKILTAQEKILKIENRIIGVLRAAVLNNTPALHQLGHSLATLDCICASTRLAGEQGYICPEIDEGTVIDIKEGRHPVVEKIAAEAFVPNDTLLDCAENHLIILTGPNMAGKSTYIRQTAILVIMAQAGLFIPAVSAKIGVVDRVFTRIGAHDDIAKGQSTFMVEMNETADILNNLTGRSLVILDEIGRGTSTFDGLSLAWALAEHLQTTKARTLFATHFHELTALADGRTGIKNYNVAVKEWQDEVIFLHKIIPGSADDSYGIYVAKLAGIPAPVIARAKKILTQLELKQDLKSSLTGQAAKSEEQFNLFTAATDSIAEKLRQSILEIDIEYLTPIQALNKLAELRRIADHEKS
ncbi:MAG: DNA mismatch repair protein MutS [Candidatus Omnitrophica bacterium]|nr:DNA mismatch repair protein MutS [Candidatus Omnitrophota bacterium]